MTRPTRPQFGSVARKTVRVSSESLLRRSRLDGFGDLPLVMEPAGDSIDLSAWAAGHREELDEALDRHGAVLFRGCGVEGVEGFEGFLAATTGGALPYSERSSPRSQVRGNIYTSTDHPPELPIFQHNEQSYNQVFPLRIAFYSVTVAQEGGATPLTDCRRVLELVDPAVRRRFEDEGYLYVRNFGDGFGLTWQTAFQTDDPGAVERYCEAHDIEAEWKGGGRLRTRQRRRAVARHPRSGALAWFNHLTFFHVTTLDPHIQEALFAELAEEDLPNNTYYADGSSIEPEVMEGLRACYHEETIAFPWQEGDLLLVDNLLVAHGRQSFAGPRKVVVGMARPTPWDSV